jgi:putative membrane protein
MVDGDAGRLAQRKAGLSLAIVALLVAVLAFWLGDIAYPWVKALHVVAAISWMAGLLYLPRLFVYHAQVAKGSPQSELFKVMERRLLSVIMTPAMGVTWVAGAWLAWRGGHFLDRWFLAKLLLLIGLSAVHGYFSAAVHRYSADRATESERHWRLMNEIPTVLMIGIVILVVVKPF